MSRRLLASALMGLSFVAVYNGCNYLTSLRSDVQTCSFAWEAAIPFVPILIIPYWSIDLFFMASPFFCPAERLTQHVRRILAAIFTAGLFFLLFPLTLAVRAPAVTGWLAPFFASLNTMNNFYNCAPSLHIALRTILWSVYVSPRSGLPRLLLGGWFLLIGLSTLLCWQHHLIDVGTGQLLGMLCLHLFPWESPPRPEVDPRRGINARRGLGLIYGLGYLLLVAGAWLSWPTGFLLLWPAAALLVVSAAYLGAGPALLGKNRGLYPRGSYWLLLPYRWAAALSARWFNAGHAPYVELEPALWLGRRVAEAPGEAVLDLTAEYPEAPRLLEKTYLNIPILDMTAPSHAQLEQAVAFVRQHREKGVYIHCSLGLGRTCAVGAAWLIAQGATPDQAVARVRAVQPRLRLTPPVLAQLGSGSTPAPM